MGEGEEDEGPELDPQVLEVPLLMPGDRCQTKPGGRLAQVKYVGVSLQGLPRGYWVGVQYEEKVGKNDGRLNGRRYFRCPPGHGGFIRATKVTKLEQPGAAVQLEDPEADEGKEEDSGAGQIGLRLGTDLATGAVDISFARMYSHRLTTAHEAAKQGTSPQGMSMAQRIAKRRQVNMTTRSPLWVRTLDDWQRDVAPHNDPRAATPATTVAMGQGLQKAIVGSLAQFTIFAKTIHSEPAVAGMDAFVVSMRGRADKGGSQPALIRTKITDRGDGSYMVEYRPWLTGNFQVCITLQGCNISGSPYEVGIVNIRPEPRRCIVRGDALNHAIARMPMKFEILFVDAMGQPAHAEDVDVYLSPTNYEEISNGKDGNDDTSDPANESVPSSSTATADPSSNTAEKDRGESTVPAPVAPEKSEATQPDTTAIATIDATQPAPDPSRSSPSSSPPDRRRSLSASRSMSPGASARGNGSPVDGYRMLDAPTRQQHLQLWQSRQTVDKLIARSYGDAGSTEGGVRRAKLDVLRPPTSFAHEMAVDPLGFAFGGVDPGTLHAHGKLVKVHSVHYSVGLAGRYKLHVGLRQQNAALPGSPFDLLVEPGKPYPTSSKLPASSPGLSGTASEVWQHGLIFQTLDVLGNTCTKGGADVTMRLSKIAAERDKGAEVVAPPVDFTVVDKGDGSYELKWKSDRAGTYPIDVLMDGAHVAGSPVQLTVRSALPAVEKMEVSGNGRAKAVAGADADINICVADRFGNKFEGSSQNFPYTLGLILNPSGAQPTDKADKKLKPTKGGDKSDGDKRAHNKGAGEDEKKAISLPFQGRINGSVFEIAYVAKEAGPMDLHLWASWTAQNTDGVAEEHREPLPGSPFQVYVTEGNAAAKGSFVGEAEAGKQGAGFVAGEHIVLRPMIRDGFGNAAAAAEDMLIARHVKPDTVRSNEKGSNCETLMPPKPKGSLGSYELVVEPTKAGTHHVHILLGTEDVAGSPVKFTVLPAAPSASKCKLMTVEPPENSPLIEKMPIAIRATLFDKYGNQLDHGGVRVDAKASGVGVSGAKVEDNKDGTYTITMTAGPPGEIKVTVRIDGNDLAPYLLTVLKNPETVVLDQSVPVVKEADSAAKDGEAEEETLPATTKGGKEDRTAKVAGKGGKGGKDDKVKDKDRAPAEQLKEKKKEEIPLNEVPWMTADTLNAMADEIMVDVQRLLDLADTLHDSFEMKLGSAILTKLSKVGKIDNMMREWDINGDGEISKIEFRQCVTGKSLKVKAENKDIDAFFSKMDQDGGGSLELHEMKPALKTLQSRTAAADAQAKDLRNKAEAKQQKIEEIRAAAAAAEAVDMADSEAPELNMAERLGSALLYRNLKIGEVVTRWDKDGDGTITMTEFRSNVVALGVEAHPLDIDKLFLQLDTDGGGSLDLDEVKKSFEKCKQMAMQLQSNNREKKAQKERLRKNASRRQSQIIADQIQEAAEEQAAAEAAEIAAAAKAAVEAEARRLAKEKAEAAAKAKEEAKRQMAEKGKSRGMGKNAAGDAATVLSE